MRKLVGLAAVLALVATAQPTHAQVKVGHTDIGPTLGLGGIGSAGMAFGGRFEKIIRPLPNMGNGTLGFQVSADYYSWSALNYKWSYTPIGATANYHFKVSDARFDPFLGLGLGYSVLSCNYSGPGTGVCANSALYVIGRAGARYFYSPKLAFYGDIGAGAATINLGMMFKMR